MLSAVTDSNGLKISTLRFNLCCLASQTFACVFCFTGGFVWRSRHVVLSM